MPLHKAFAQKKKSNAKCVTKLFLLNYNAPISQRSHGSAINAKFPSTPTAHATAPSFLQG